ncbi:MAG TPA: processed acidic surface protein, partial [Pseudoneobacillus sp.]|nr:processed acidic surface protein [Pseudoneobacillus sp.]
LMKMETTNGADLMIEIYTASGELLADLVFPENLLSEYEVDGKPVDAVISEVKDDAIQVASMVQKKAAVSNKVKTVMGGKLPKTASNFGLKMLLGLFMVIVGAWVYRKFIVKGA